MVFGIFGNLLNFILKFIPEDNICINVGSKIPSKSELKKMSSFNIKKPNH